jgi:hypothetical protein
MVVGTPPHVVSRCCFSILSSGDLSAVCLVFFLRSGACARGERNQARSSLALLAVIEKSTQVAVNIL